MLYKLPAFSSDLSDDFGYRLRAGKAPTRSNASSIILNGEARDAGSIHESSFGATDSIRGRRIKETASRGRSAHIIILPCVVSRKFRYDGCE